MLRRLIVPLVDWIGWLEFPCSLIWGRAEDEDEGQTDRVYLALVVTVVSLALIFGGGGLVFFGVTRIVDGGWNSVPQGGGQVVGGLVAFVLGGRFVPRWTARWTRPMLPSGGE